MSEVLYVVNTNETNKGKKLTIIATLEKDGSKYRYKPYGVNKSSTTVGVVLETAGLPPIAQRRLYNKNRPDIDRILSKYGLDTYDEWELLKRTNGMLVTDNILYLTESELNSLKDNMNAFDYTTTEEAVALSF